MLLNVFPAVNELLGHTAWEPACLGCAFCTQL